jgi:hypothetical protein
MDTKDIPVLVVTPQPTPTESFRGYTLRLSEANGLLTPASMLGVAGMDPWDIRLARHPLEIIAGLAGKEAAELQSIAYSQDNVNGEPRLLGHPLALSYLSLRDPKICPECIQEQGFIPARWDLASYTVCHVHKKQLSTSCPACKQKLKWFRPGLLTCNCGESLTEANTETVEHPVDDLSKALTAVLERSSLSDADASYGLPLSALSMMSLRTLVGLIHTLGEHKLQLEGQSSKEQGVNAQVRAAAETLAYWPQGFLHLMELDMAATSNASSSLRLRHINLYGKLFKMGYPETEMEIFRDAMILHANNHSDFYVIDRRIAKKSQLAPTVTDEDGIKGAALKAGVMPSTMHRWIKKGKVTVARQLAGKTPSIIDQNLLAQLMPLTKESLALRDAAAFIGLPVSVLQGLRELGVYKQRHRTVLPQTFPVADLKAMVEEFVSRAHPVPDHEAGTLIYVATLMSRIFRSKSIKAELLNAMHQHELMVFGQAETICELLVSDLEASRLADKLMIKHSGQYSMRQASEMIGCNIDTLKGMTVSGFFKHEQSQGVIYFDCEQIDAFIGHYMPLSQLLKPHGYSPARGCRVADSKGIELLKIRRHSGNGIQPFVSRSNAELLLSYMSE